MSTLEHEAPQPQPPQSHHLPASVVANQQRRAVLFFILADAVFFACLLFTFFYLKSLNVNGGWLPDGTHTAPAWPVWLVAGVTVVGAFVHRSGELGIKAGQRARFTSSALVALIIALASMALVIYQISTWNILMSDGAYASTFIVLVWVQLAHLLILVVLALGIWIRGGQGKFDDGNYTHVMLVGYFWYWVALTAVLGGLTTLFTT